MENSSGADITLAAVASTGSAADVAVNNASVTATNVQGAIKELKDDIVSLEENTATIVEETGEESLLDIRDFLIKKGTVVTVANNVDSDNETTSGLSDGTYLKLIINSKENAESENKVYISTISLVDVYTAAQNAQEVQLDVNNFVLSATIVGVDSSKVAYLNGESVKQALQRIDGGDSITGSVDNKIKSAIKALDATVSISDQQNTNPLNISITQTDGVLTGITGSIDAETFDAYGSAETVLGDVDDTAQDITVYGAHKRIENLEDDIEERDLHTPVITGEKTGTVSKIYADGTEIASLSDGAKGDTGNGILSVELNNDYTLTFNYTDNTSETTGSIRGAKGDKGDSPVITASKAGSTTTILSDGVAIGTVLDGAKGEDGNTPVITASKSGKVTTISSDGTAIATINDGVDGEDYILTATDKQDIAELVVGMEIDDTAGDGDTNKTWSADKITDELANAGTVKDVTIDGTSVVDSNGEAVIPTATASTFGVMKLGSGLALVGDKVTTNPASSEYIKSGTAHNLPIVPSRQHMSTFYGLAKASGDATQSQSNNSVGTYTDNAKSSIKQMLDIPVSSYDLNTGSLIPASADLNTYTASGVYHADDSVISTVSNSPTITTTYKLVVETVSENTVKQTITTTDGKTYIRTGNSENDIWTFGSWINAVKDVKINNDSIVNANGEAVISTMTQLSPGVAKVGQGLTVNTNGQLQINKAFGDAIKNGVNEYQPIVPVKQHESVFYGLAKAAGDTTQSTSDNAVGTYTEEAKQAIKVMLDIPTKAYDLNNGTLIPASADLNTYTTVGVYHADQSVISTITDAPTVTTTYKLVVEITGENAIKQTVTATDGKTYTRTGTSTNDIWTFSSWVSMITSVDYASTTNAGIVKVDQTYGVSLRPAPDSDVLMIKRAEIDSIKTGRQNCQPIVPGTQYLSVFYGLAKAAGDSTQSASPTSNAPGYDNAYGTYTEEAKQSIRTMLGISNDAGVPYELTQEDVDDISDAVYESLVNTVTVSGTDPTITAEENTRYICGELLSLNFTPCQTGICDIRFTSGSTLTVLTLPSTVKLPDWFEVETNRTYEISIMDGVFGTVTSWSI